MIFTYVTSVVIGLHEEPVNFYWAKRCFHDWPFVYFSGGFISHLSSDYANINMLKSDYMKAWNSIKNNSGHFVENKRHQETGTEYFTLVQMILKEEGY